jgi:A nuclease family of the HNH/ENDO VII superfamily with conserved AHH
MEVGELVKVALEAPHTKEGCPFCRPKEEVNEENYLRAKYDEDIETDNDSDNCSGTLAKNLKERPQGLRREVPAIEKKETAPIHDMEMASAPGRDWHQWVYDAGLIPVLYGAHHLIPGNDGLTSSDLYKGKWLGPEDNGPDADNVGYNINSANNGMWLPGNYAVRPWKGIDSNWQEAYAFLAMLDTNRQFHDSHKPYSKVVRKALNNLSKLMKKMAQKGCPNPSCGSGAKKGEPPYHLNSRLNAISNHLSKHLRGDPIRNWKNPMFTSGWAKEYRDYVKKLGGFKKARVELDKLRMKKNIK